MKKSDIKEGLALYDERNGRSIFVLRVYEKNGTALCNTEEDVYDEETDTVIDTLADTQLFGLSELTHFKEVDAW